MNSTSASWVFEPRFQSIMVDMDNNGQYSTIADLYSWMGREEAAHNGQLMAAAPDLLNAATEMLKAYTDFDSAQRYVPNDFIVVAKAESRFADSRNAMFRAIKKATESQT